MVKKTNQRIITGLILVVLAALIVLQSTGNLFALVGEEVFIPKYFTGECIPRADNLATVNIIETDQAAFYDCTSSGSKGNKWIPEVAGIQCEFIVDVQRQFLSTAAVDVWDCPAEVRNTGELNKCQRVLFFSDNENINRITIDAGRRAYIKPVLTAGLFTVKVDAKYPSYGLRIRTQTQYVSPVSTSCAANNVPSGFHSIDLEEALVVVPGIPFNAITGQERARTTQLVSLKDVENGETIFIDRPGFYFKVTEADDGFKYVDTTKEFSDSDIQCIPRTTGCSDEAKVVNLVDQSCDAFGGAITGFSPVQGDQTKLCKYSCSGGKLSLTNDCISVKTSCPSDKPLWDANTGECVSNNVIPKNTTEGDDLIIILIVAIVVLAIIIIMAVIASQRKGKKK